MIEPDEISRILKEKITDCELVVEDLTGAKDHFQVMIVSPEFDGKSMIEQHQLVYSALKEQMVKAIHALTLKTFTPQAWAKKTAAQKVDSQKPRGIS